MVNGIVEIVYYAVLGPGMDTSRPKPYIICFTYSVDKKKGQATLMIQVACPFSSACFIKTNKSPFGKQALYELNLFSRLTEKPG